MLNQHQLNRNKETTVTREEAVCRGDNQLARNKAMKVTSKEAGCRGVADLTAECKSDADSSWTYKYLKHVLSTRCGCEDTYLLECASFENTSFLCL